MTTTCDNCQQVTDTLTELTIYLGHAVFQKTQRVQLCARCQTLAGKLDRVVGQHRLP